MLRARLWYGPAGHGLALDRVARYLAGPLACQVRSETHIRFGRRVQALVLHDPIAAMIELDRRPEVSAEAADLIARLPASAPPALALKLAGCTARLDLHDAPGQRLIPSSGPARSVLVPLAFAMDGLVEDLESGRLSHFRLPGTPPRNWLARILSGLLRR
ncbi:hypothetical protein [Rhodovulum strictum]|uniref:Uncharacterized protein n=1 Tax=Rhodovulum strictum TaxID=58314 RepID=A0A844BET2_9RHOB|nr:hypothetical protein [Rhodovulum strictum]MRH21109.1 hypothetical protein [Rhodovulum strictum]